VTKQEQEKREGTFALVAGVILIGISVAQIRARQKAVEKAFDLGLEGR